MTLQIVLITDAWEPQVNGVVTTYKNILANLPDNVVCHLIMPSMFKSYKAPVYQEIDLAFVSVKTMQRILMSYYNDKSFNTKFHIATEGPLGIQAKRALDVLKINYTTAYHTKFPEFLQAMFKVPVKVTQKYINWFHAKSKNIMVPSQSVLNENPHWKCTVLGRGYDSNFEPKERAVNEIPILLYVGRVSKEKNIDAFCDIDIPSRKIIVGDGPDRKRLEKKYKAVEFTGYMFASQLALYYNMADVMVFPSVTDAFGVVILESMACGTPVAAYPVTGPIDQIINNINGYMSNDLKEAVQKCLSISRADTRNSVESKNWKTVSKEFVKFIDAGGCNENSINW